MKETILNYFYTGALIGLPMGLIKGFMFFKDLSGFDYAWVMAAAGGGFALFFGFIAAVFGLLLELDRLRLAAKALKETKHQ